MTSRSFGELFGQFLFKTIFASAFLCAVSVSLYGQAGSYYDALNPSASTFVSDLKSRIRVPYTKVSYDNYDETFVTNFAAINNGNGTKSVICVYSSYEYIYSGTFTWGVMSREHTFCHSWMPTFNSTSGNEYSDQHHLFPTQQNNANGVRSNHPLGVVTNVTSQFIDCKLGTNTQGQLVFEPRDKQKGDAARALLYMMARYDDVNGLTWNFNWLNNTRLPSLSEAPQSLETLLAWHRQDPPDRYEVRRGNYVQSVQSNRNPFVDHPEYVNYINFNNLTKLNPVYANEPGNYPTALSASSTSSSVTINWTDAAAGTQAPSGYLVQIFSADDYFLPIDGEVYTDDINVTDGKGIFNVSHTGGANGVTFNGLSASVTYYVTIYSFNGDSTLRNYKINGTLPQINKTTGASSNTVVNFMSTSATVKEDTGSVAIKIGIVNPGVSAATTVQVALISGDSTDLNNYSAQTVVFPAGASGEQTVTVNITDDALLEGDEAFVFKLQNVSGGSNPSIGGNFLFTLTVRDNDLTTVQFTSASAMINEGDGTHNLALSIYNPNALLPAAAKVTLISGNPADIGGFTSQILTFPAGSTAVQNIVLTITDDNETEPAEFFEFLIDSVGGGNSGQPGVQSLYTLTIIDNESISVNLLDNFNRENGAAVGSTPTTPVSLPWIETETVAGSAVSIDNNMLKMSSGTSGKEFAYLNMSGLAGYPVVLNNANGLMVWSVNMKHTRPNPSGFDGGNYGIAFVLAKSTSAADGGVGYAVVHGNSGSVDPLRLAKFSSGFSANAGITNIIAAGAYGSAYHSIKVVFDPSNSSWSLYADSSSAGFPYSDPRNASTLLGTAVDNTYTGISLPYLGCLWNHNVTATEYAVFDDVYISDPGGMLPVELVSFTAEIAGESVLLNWKTATEVNNRGFEVFKLKVKREELKVGVANEEWEKAGFVQGRGNSSEMSLYTFTDVNIEAGNKYRYRLKQIDNDGSYKYTDGISVAVPAPEKYALMQNFPNPFNPVTVIKYSIPQVSSTESTLPVVLKIYDITGKEVAVLVNEARSAGSYSVEFDASKLPSGIYFYSLAAGGFREVKKLTLLK